MFGIKKVLKRFKKVRALPGLTQCKSLNDVAFYLVNKYKIDSFSFLEIGVFKGDNAIALISWLKTFFSLSINYIGFDLFDEITYLEENYPEDYKAYNLADFPYWEFESGGHTLAKVNEKLSQVILPQTYELVKGDTTLTLPAYIKTNSKKIDLIYVDGCHDYVVVKEDWKNCESLFAANPKLVIAFDDFSYPGVKTVYETIISSGQYNVHVLNENQFIVYIK